MIIFESILTTFEASVVFEAAETVEGIDSSLKPKDYRYVSLVQIFETVST